MNARINDPHRAQRELLSGCQLLGGLPATVLEALVAASRVVELGPNRVLYEAGDAIREAFILFSGSVNRSAVMPSGATRIVQLVQREQLLSPGEVFGETHYRSSCTGISQAVLVAIDARRLREFTHQNAELSGRIIGLLAARQCATEFDATGYHYGLTGAQRLLDYLLELAGNPASLAGETTVLLKANKKVIAARIGMTAESFSRNLRELSDSGVIVVDGRNVHIQNAALHDTAGGSGRQRLNFSRKPKGKAASAKMSSGALINLCGRLRLNSQRLALAWIALVSGLAPSRERIRLRRFEREFVRNLARLDRLELADELRTELDVVQVLWADYRQTIDTEDAAQAGRVFAVSEEMLTAADRLTMTATRLAGVPAASHVNQAGRNRMLSQQISKLFLFRDQPALQERIAELSPPACDEFERNLRELVQAAGDRPEIVAQLGVVDKQWRKFARALCPDLMHTGKNQHARLVLVEGERLLRCIDTAVKLFERLSQ